MRSSARGSPVPLSSIADAYSTGAAAWADGPSRVYGRLAELLVAFSPEPLVGHRVLDHGSGTGVGSRAALAAGAIVVATDLAPAMLRVDQWTRPPAAVSDALALPFRTGAFDAVLAAFSLNHFDDPAVGLREAIRVAPIVLASTYASDDDHPAKGAVETALEEHGWRPPLWYVRVKQSMRSWGTVADATIVIERANATALKVERVEVPFDDLSADDLIAWRLGLAHTAPFLSTLDPATQDGVKRRARELLGPSPTPLIRKVIFLAAG